MPFHCTVRCRCGHTGEFRFPNWQTGHEMLRRARCTVCGAKGTETLTIGRVIFLVRDEGKMARKERNH